LDGTTITPEVLAKQIDSLISSLQIKRVHAVFGVGMGALASLTFAALYPAKVGRVVAIGHDISKSERELGFWAEKIQYAEKYTMEGVIVDKIVALWLTVDQRGSEIWKLLKEMVRMWRKEDLAAYAELYFTYDETERYKSLKRPITLIVGAQDSVLPEVMAEIPRKIGKDSSIEVSMVSRSSHLPMLEQPLAFLEGFTTVIS
jgi:pimeloyl-ACP methyl ester carboxylesterase